MKHQNSTNYCPVRSGATVLWLVLVVSLLGVSCGTSVNMMRHGSVFSGTNLLGISTADLVSRYGKPFSTSLEKVDEKTVESYYYVEIISKENPFTYSGDIAIAVTTRFVFHDDVLVKQDNDIDFESQEIQRLKKEVRRSKNRSN